MNKLYSIILTLMVGIFFLIGGMVSKSFKDKHKIEAFSISLALVIMIGLILFDLVPEIFDLLDKTILIKKISIILCGVIIGVFLLKIIDCFIPDHHHEHHECEKNIKEHTNHEKHIGVLSVFGLVLHNVLEGFAIFGVAISDFKIGLFTCVSVALHNIPLGIHIFNSLDIHKNKLLLILLTLSSLVGGLIFLVVGNIPDFVLAAITSITLGMLIYIVVLELIPEMINYIQKKEAKIGILVGLFILVISIFIE